MAPSTGSVSLTSIRRASSRPFWMSGKAGISESVRLARRVVYKQIYWPETNVLVTRFLSEDGVAEIIDYMPVGAPREDQGFHGLVRQVKVVRGRMTFRMECFPAFNYGRDPHTVEVVSGGARFLSPKLNLALAADYPIQKIADGVWGEFTLEQQQSASFELHQLDPAGSDQIGVNEQDAYRLFTETVEYLAALDRQMYV